MPNARPPVEERLGRPSVMGVINVTPDSFSDGGEKELWIVRHTFGALLLHLRH
jgi:dihydropteroate synthase